MNDIKITHNGYTADVKVIDGSLCLPLKDLIKLTGRCRSLIYNTYNINTYKLNSCVLTPAKRRNRVLSLDGCIKLLKCMYMPDDGLIKKIDDVINKQTQTNTMPDISLGEKVEELNKKFDDLYKKTTSIVIDLAKQVDDMGERQSKFMNMVSNKIEALEKRQTTNKSPDNVFKSLLKEVLIDALKGGLNND